MLYNRWVRSLTVYTLAAASVLLAAQHARAGHFRYGNLSWEPVGANTAVFRFTAVFQRTEFDPPLPLMGQIITEEVGFTPLEFGDGLSTGPLEFLVTFVDLANDRFTGEARIALSPLLLPPTVVNETDSAPTNDTTGDAAWD